LLDLEQDAVIYIIGVNHSFQLRAVLPVMQGGLLDEAPSAHIAVALESYITKIIEAHHIRAVAEEYCSEILQRKRQTDPQAHLVAQRACEANGYIQHVFCDPDFLARKKLYAEANISEAHDEASGFPVREAEWLRRLQPYLSHGNVLFLCGACHISSFSRLLTAKGFPSIILCQDFKATFFTSER
jgi:hypothetical protein